MKNITVLNVIIFLVGIVFVIFNKHVSELHRQTQILYFGQAPEDPGLFVSRTTAVIFGIVLIAIGIARST